MKAYFLHIDRLVEPFGIAPVFCLIGNKTLKEIQEGIFKAIGIDLNDIDSDLEAYSGHEECLVFSDSLYFSKELVEEFLNRCRKLNDPTVFKVTCVLKRGGFTLRSAINLQDLDGEIGLDYYPFGLSGNEDHGFKIDMEIDPDELNASIATPNHISGVNRYAIPLTTKPLIQINHWVNLWVANIVEALLPAARLQSSSILKQLWLAIKSRSLNKWVILRQANVFGKGCDIHPTAYVEGSVIGDNVTIGAGTIVRNSAIGNNVSIGNGIVIEESVIGENSVILHGRVIFSVIGPETFSVGDMITASLVGKSCFIGLNSTLTDFRLDDRNVVVHNNGNSGEMVDSGNRFLGSCLGDGVYVGAGCVVAPGRMIPAGVKLALSEDRIVRSPGKEEIPGFRIL